MDPPAVHFVFAPFASDDEALPTSSSREQALVESHCSHVLALAYTERARGSGTGAGPLALPEAALLDRDTGVPILLRETHTVYLNRLFSQALSSHFIGLDSSRGWLCYWTLHALDLLGSRPPPAVLASASELMLRCQWPGSTDSGAAYLPKGGFGGGVGQSPHVLSCYASVLTLLIAGDADALARIDRPGLLAFYRSCKAVENGGFRVQPDGEQDVRATYAAVAIAELLGILTPDLAAGAAEYVLACQTLEGGFGGEPGNEAHGGYTFCAVAALEVLGQLHRARIPDLLRWLCNRQMAIEGGFSGRSNKLVDGCYSFWQGAVFAILQRHVTPGHGLGTLGVPTPAADASAAASAGAGAAASAASSAGGAGGASGAAAASGAGSAGIGPRDPLFFDRRKLQLYSLLCCQQPDGGLRDKPSKPRDHYHTCYVLSGLSIAQHDAEGRHVYGSPETAVGATHPVYNIKHEHVLAARSMFEKRPL